MSSKRLPIPVILLIILMVFESLGALYGGIILIIDPTGSLLKMPLTMLSNTPFSNYFIPGIILGILLGVIPSFAAVGLVLRPRWKWANRINLYRDRHFGWSYSLYTGIMLNIWITIQIFLVGYGALIQTIYALVAIFIIIVCLLPVVMNHYQQQDEPEKGVWRTLGRTGIKNP